ncbi:hypothetical protein SUGI_0638570 [Cryptomeria japonica]|uniref:uncharacterized protein LOC131052881 n=1 Tax=Cryptomeria japonica TaxID=3369 RepID=UPI002414A0AD|nr:uncharacterized protein LOC131052881 [Cryptomeria japonica]GLJ31746.1 hypothetical protein SUGI_0638570 [Cryptomeria japonica]
MGMCLSRKRDKNPQIGLNEFQGGNDSQRFLNMFKSRSRLKCNAKDSFSDIKSVNECNGKSERQKESVSQLQGECSLYRSSVVEEGAAFGSPISISREGISTEAFSDCSADLFELDLSEDHILGRVSDDVFSVSLSDLLKLESLDLSDKL